ncbi:protein CBFA2T1-like isoform X2 [Haliotis rufescens]|uniref:protein CBFA2T1-like isoform X2 n=1 Tax=Haliotis rufescens TaxID=6454 RepID=UPI001EB09C58|nr:protein CBFA2T1-like isoform X2 [Haliotis rufescens]
MGERLKPLSLMNLVKSSPQRYNGIPSHRQFNQRIWLNYADQTGRSGYPLFRGQTAGPTAGQPDYYRDSIMPDSPESKGVTQTTSSPAVSTMASIPPITRPISSGSTASGLNGSHSPLSSINGRTPSPPSMTNSSMCQQLPPACGARQLSKLKRFLTTLQQFGSDISPEIGERVRMLVLGLVNSHLSIEEFHAKLQEATNFPLRPFVIPFLKANLPLLQRELLHCARMAKTTPQQYLAQNEHIVFDPAHSPLESTDSIASDMNENGKRRSPDRPKENGVDSSHMDSMHPAKRHHPMSPMGSSRISPNGSLNLNTGGPIRLEDISISREIRERERIERERMDRERMERERDRDRHYTGYSGYQRNEPFDPLERLDDDWRHVETMLNCIIGMVDKTKRALSVLQERSLRDREELSVWMRRHAEGMDQDVKKRTSDMMAYTMRQTEDRVSEVRRRAEEAVNEVKRQAMLELQKAVTTAEQKASEMVTIERNKMDRQLTDVKKQTQEEVVASINHQEESSESCWNCGRKASETCSGCNIARYCGSFCQHKDWESHHHVCGKAQVASIAEARDQRKATNRERGDGPPGKIPDMESTPTPTPKSPQQPEPSPTASVTSVASAASTANSLSGSRSSTPAENRSSDATR